MANWKKKEAGFIVFKNRANSEQFVCDSFHNKEEMEAVIEKFRLLNLDKEYYIGTFSNNNEIEIAMETYKLKNGANKQFFNEPEKQEHWDDMGPEPHLNVSLEVFLRNWNKAKAMSDKIWDMDELAEKGVIGMFPCFNKEAMVNESAKEELQQLYSKPMLYKMSEKVLFMMGIVFVDFTDKPINYV